MDLSIVIVNWNSTAFLRECLRSIYTTAANLQFEVIVIDNASFDGSQMMVRTEFPAVEFIQSRRNLGFAGANNVAFARSSGRNVLFLNPDTELTGDALRVMCSALDAIPDAGVVGCRLLNSNRSLQTSCIQAFPSILNQTFDFELLQALFPKSSFWGMRPLYERRSQPSIVDIVSGACLMIRRIVFEQVGQFSTDYFMYAEDMDLCYKVARAGWRSYFVGDATVIHHGGRSSRIRPNHFASIMMRESKLTFMRARHGRAYAVRYQCAAAAISIARLVILTAALPLAIGKSRREKVRASLTKWFKILRWSIGLESWARTYTQAVLPAIANPVHHQQGSAAKAAEKI
jgi:N-acetylglucosaminyl-diphospho-decaprenol L-rhamnosyltransferase